VEQIEAQHSAIMFGNRTAQGIADLLALQPRKIERDRAIVGQAAGLNDTYEASTCSRAPSAAPTRPCRV
jgi:hypothetical protein